MRASSTLRLEGVQRQLAEAEQAAERRARRVRAEHRSCELSLQARIAELERRASEIQRGLEAERAARERSERLLESMREGHRRMEALLGEMQGIVGRVSAALARASRAARGRRDRSRRRRCSPRRCGAPRWPTRSRLPSSACERVPRPLRSHARRPTRRRPPVGPARGRPQWARRRRSRHSRRARASGRIAPVVQRPTAAEPPAAPRTSTAMSWFARRRIKTQTATRTARAVSRSAAGRLACSWQ